MVQISPEKLHGAIIDALGQGATRLALRLVLTITQEAELVADASGDSLDAVLCLMQAAWAIGQSGFGLPTTVDPVEGWIASS